MSTFTFPDPHLLDADPVTDKWPLPPVKEYEPQEPVTFWRRMQDAIDEMFGLKDV